MIAHTPTTPSPVTVESTKRKTSSKKTIHQIPHGCAYIHSSFNNTIITVTDLNGNTIAWASAGHCGFRGPKKATPYASSVMVKTVAEKLKPFGVRDLTVFVSGVGSGRDPAVRALNANGFTVLSIKDTTGLAHNGCRAPRPRRM
jgi:small subunit ribosomal protein S11